MFSDIFLCGLHPADSDKLRNKLASKDFCFLLIRLYLFYVAQILILNFLYSQHSFYYPSRFLKHNSRTSVCDKNLKLFNRVNEFVDIFFFRHIFI